MGPLLPALDRHRRRTPVYASPLPYRRQEQGVSPRDPQPPDHCRPGHRAARQRAGRHPRTGRDTDRPRRRRLVAHPLLRRGGRRVRRCVLRRSSPRCGWRTARPPASRGCNEFSGSYELDGSSLTFGEEMSVTLAFCEGPGQLLEDSLPRRPRAASAAGPSRAGNCSSTTTSGDLILDLRGAQHPVDTDAGGDAAWPRSRPCSSPRRSSSAEIDTLRADTDALNVPRLRERIKALEAENKKLTKRARCARGCDPRSIRHPGPRHDLVLRGGEGPAQGHPHAHRQLLQPAALVAAQGHPGGRDLPPQHQGRSRASTTSSWRVSERRRSSVR